MHKRIVVAAMATLALAACDRGASNETLLEPDFARGGQQGANANANVNLRRGAVYSMSNAREGNQVIAFSRANDGTLTEVGRFDTGGTGSGSFEDTANGLVLGNASGETSPNNLGGAAQLLFATNAGSNSISVFSVEKDRLERVEVQSSGGEKPVSVTVSNGLLYVLNSGERLDDLIVENCATENLSTGVLPTITGFRVDNRGQLTPIPNSTRTLSGDLFSGCAQVSFSPDGKVLVVTEREAEVLPGQSDNEIIDDGDEGVIVTFTVNRDGTLGNKQIFDATGQGPFGFTFTKAGILLVSEQFDGPAGVGRGAGSAYAVNRDGTLVPTSGSVANGGTDTCWFVATDNGKLAFAASFFEGGQISSYRVGPQGSLELIQAVAADAALGAADLALSRNSKFLYNVNAFQGTISAYRVGNDGGLTLIQTVEGFGPSAMAGRLGLAAN